MPRILPVICQISRYVKLLDCWESNILISKHCMLIWVVDILIRFGGITIIHLEAFEIKLPWKFLKLCISWKMGKALFFSSFLFICLLACCSSLFFFPFTLSGGNQRWRWNILVLKRLIFTSQFVWLELHFVVDRSRVCLT